MFACYPGGLSEEEPTAGDDLLRQIWEDPDDPARLSVYADWLIEHDDATRGEYIQLALLDAPTPEQLARRDGIFRRNRARWVGPARSYLRTWVDSVQTPGFPSRVVCTAEQLEAGFELIRDLAPNITVVLEYSPRFEHILPYLPLGQLHGLALPRISGRYLARLESALAGIARLELTDATWTLAPEHAVAVIEQHESLVELELRSDVRTDRYLRALLDCPESGRLVSLEIAEPDDPVLRERAQAHWGAASLIWIT